MNNCEDLCPLKANYARRIESLEIQKLERLLIEDADETVEAELDAQIRRLTVVRESLGLLGCAGAELRPMDDGAERAICHDPLFGK